MSRLMAVVGLGLICFLIASMSAVASPGASAHKCLRGNLHTIYRGTHKCLDLDLRKQIFRSIVRYQDTHPGQDVRAYSVIAKRYRIATATAWKIGAEGAAKNWPMPPPPG